MLKVKTLAEDFTVEERVSLALRGKGRFPVYLLQKRGWNTVELLQVLAERSKIPFDKWSYGGRKDKYGSTTQYVSVRGQRIPDIEASGYTLRFSGYAEEMMSPAHIIGNAFTVTLRRLEDVRAARLAAAFKEASAAGFENYFDDQRFGSFDPATGWAAERMYKGHFNGAWQAVTATCRTEHERAALSALKARCPKALDALKALPREVLLRHLSAYQGFVWNEMLRAVVEGSAFAKDACRVQGKAGEYVFLAFSVGKSHPAQGLALPAIGANMPALYPAAGGVYEQVCRRFGLSKAVFNRMKVRQAYAASFLRDALARPGECACSAAEDELHPGRKKLILSFFLGRGSYATMLLKKMECACGG